MRGFLVVMMLVGYGFCLSDEDGYKLLLRDYYKYYDLEYDLVRAALVCLADGAELYYPESEEEGQLVQDTIIPENVTKITIGIYNDYQTDNFIAIDGSENYLNGFETGDAVVYPLKSVVLYQNLTMRATSDETHTFVCKKKHYNSQPIQRKGDYKELEEFEAMYKFVPESFHNHSTILNCLSDGAELYYPETSEEAEIVFLSIVPKDVNYIIVGIHNVFRKGFITVDDKRDYFVNWDPDQPNDDEDWVILGRDMTYASMPSAKYAGVCKKRLKQQYEGECTSHNNDYMFRDDKKILYKFHSKSVTWFEANKICMEENGALAAPVDDAKKTWISEFIDKNCLKYSSVWSGFQNLNSIVTNLKDEEISILNNEENEYYHRNYYYNEMSTTQKPKTNTNGCGIWTNQKYYRFLECNLKRPFLCEIDPAIQNYHYNKEVDMSYELSPQPMTWSDARLYCRDQKATLAMPRNKNQMSVLVEQLDSHSEQTFFLGFHSKLRVGLFSTLYGSMPISSELQWQKNRNNLTKTCGGMLRNGFLASVDCELHRYFFCEKTGKISNFF